MRSGPVAAAEPAVGRFWHGPGREGKRARDEVCGEEPERGSEDGSGAREGEHVTDGPDPNCSHPACYVNCACNKQVAGCPGTRA